MIACRNCLYDIENEWMYAERCPFFIDLQEGPLRGRWLCVIAKGHEVGHDCQKRDYSRQIP